MNVGDKGKTPLLPTAVREGSPRKTDRIREKDRACKKSYMQGNLRLTASTIWDSNVSKCSACTDLEGSTSPTAGGLVPVAITVDEPCSACIGLEGWTRPTASGLVAVSISVDETCSACIGLEGSTRPITSGLVPVSISVNEIYLTGYVV